MHHDLELLISITMALLTAFAGGYLARRIGLPSLVGYLLAGMAIGPFTPALGAENTPEALQRLFNASHLVRFRWRSRRSA